MTDSNGTVGGDMKETEPWRVCEGVYQVAGPDMTSVEDCCVYVVDGGGPLALVDSGCGRSYDSILSNMRLLDLEPERLEILFLTHCHVDHAGAAAKFKEGLGVELVAHEKEAAPLEAGDQVRTAAFLYGVRIEPLPVERKLGDEGGVIPVGELEVRAVHTPGHTPGSISLLLDTGGKRVLFGQDIHGPFHPDFGSDIDIWRASMKKLLDLQPDVLCEGHFGVFSPAKEAVAYIESQLDRYRPL